MRDSSPSRPKYRDLVPFLDRLRVGHLVLEIARRRPSELDELRELRPEIGIGVGVIDIKDTEVESAGGASHTKYYRIPIPARVTIVRRHHPLQGQSFEVLRVGKTHLVVQSADGMSLKLPCEWTDVDGLPPPPSDSFLTKLSVGSIRELLALVAALRARA
ncbi:MAG: DUF5372 family protein [Planctomycetota bacterium]